MLASTLGDNEVALCNAVQCRTMFLASTGDPKNVRPGGLMQQAMEAKAFSKDCHFEAFPQAHGWVNRGDLANEELKRDYEKSVELLVGFYQKHL